MITDERFITYMNSLEREEKGILAEIEQEAIRDNVPIIRKETQSLLKVLIAMKGPKKILEVGTAVGFSALLMSKYAGEYCHITTIEKYEKRIPVAKENFKRANKEGQITLLEGDALSLMEKLEDTYDFIFMDAAKAQYIHFLPHVLRLLDLGGVLVSDNILQEGTILESRYAVERRDRTIHARMREYLYELKHEPALLTTILPIGDGVSISTKTADEKGDTR